MSLDAAITLDEIRASHASFWEGKGLLTRIKPYIPVGNHRLPIKHIGVGDESIRLRPEMLEPEYITQTVRDFAASELPREGDVYAVRGPCKIPWTEAIMGCPIKFLPQSHVAWAESYPLDFSRLDKLKFREENAWVEKLVEITRALVENAGGRYLVTHTTMRGPLDMTAAMLGAERLCLMLFDQPRQLQELLGACAEVFVQTAQAQWDAIPPIAGGHVCRYGIWAPGRVTRCQADAAAMISPQLYRRVIFPHDVEVLRSFSYNIMHTHSAHLHVAKHFLEEDALRALQVGYDQPPFGPPVKTLLPQLKHILKHKPLVFHGVVSREEINILANELPPDGLFLDLLVKES